ncbi:MAG TPA: S8 family serine peptidase [Candidatus Angelobacter sp.]
MKRKLRVRLAACALAGALWLTACAAAQVQSDKSAGSEFEWRFSIKPNQTISSGITAENRCRRHNRFEIDQETLPSFMRLSGKSSFNVDARSKHVFPVRFDSTGLAAGKYESLVVIKCVTCRENGCSQDRQSLHIYMTVEEQDAAQFVPNRVLVTIPFDSFDGVEAAAKKLAAAHGLALVEIHRLDSIHAALIVYALPVGSDVTVKVAELAPEVLMAQPDYLYRTTGGGLGQTGSPATLQYGPKLIHADRLRSSLTGKGVRVAMIDTGIDINHPALKGKIAEQFDTTGKGFTADVHGTLLAGIIASEPANSTGITGMAPGCEILAIKACQPESPQSIQAQCSSLTLTRGLDLVLQKKARIINFSLSGPNDKLLLARLIDEASNRGIVMIAAAGNDGPRGQPGYPAALPKVIAVTAVDANEQLYSQATQGDFIALAAPGVEIVSTSPGGKLMVSSGTSFAAAFVTGISALILEQQPQLSPAALQSLLERTAKDLGRPGKDPQFGSGLVDACKAVAQLRDDPKLCQ